MRDYITIGSTPRNEDCQQVPYSDYNLAMRECKQFIEAIRKALGNEPERAHLVVKGFSHNFGTYHKVVHEVVCYYDKANEQASEYAFKCKSDSPSTWAEVGMVAPTKEIEKDVVNNGA